MHLRFRNPRRSQVAPISVHPHYNIKRNYYPKKIKDHVFFISPGGSIPYTLNLDFNSSWLKNIMFYGDTIQDTRQLFFVGWQKYKQKNRLLPLEKQLVDVILLHPEYHALLEAGDVQSSYFPELGQSNPFLHMGLHLTIRDQIATDRPLGIASAFQQLLKKYADVHTVEHLIMEPLAECLWHAQRNQRVPDEEAYLMACRQL